MKFTTIIFIAVITFFIVCGDSSNSTNVSSDTSVTPQPSVTDESVRPPKPPSI